MCFHTWRNSKLSWNFPLISLSTGTIWNIKKSLKLILKNIQFVPVKLMHPLTCFANKFNWITLHDESSVSKLRHRSNLWITLTSKLSHCTVPFVPPNLDSFYSPLFEPLKRKTTLFEQCWYNGNFWQMCWPCQLKCNDNKEEIPSKWIQLGSHGKKKKRIQGSITRPHFSNPLPNIGFANCSW